MARAFALAGAAGPLVFVGTVIRAGWADPGYSHLSRAVSELGESGAPHASWVAAGWATSALLVTAFGAGILRSAGRGDGGLAWTGSLLVAYGAMAFLLAVLFPMDPMDGPLTWRGVAHIAFVAVSAFTLVALLLVGGRRIGRVVRGFHAYSLASIGLMLAGGAASGLAAAAGLPMVGLGERLTQAAYLAWIVVLAILLLRRPQLVGAAERRPLTTDRIR